MGIRHHFDKLIRGGWIECRKSSKDARVKLVFPTDKLLKEIDMLSHNFQSSLLNLQLIIHESQTEFHKSKIQSKSENY
jgi:DNA-binding MarR family transcriptional regulator